MYICTCLMRVEEGRKKASKDIQTTINAKQHNTPKADIFLKKLATCTSGGIHTNAHACTCTHTHTPSPVHPHIITHAHTHHPLYTLTSSHMHTHTPSPVHPHIITAVHNDDFLLTASQSTGPRLRRVVEGGERGERGKVGEHGEGGGSRRDGG